MTSSIEHTVAAGSRSQRPVARPSLVEAPLLGARLEAGTRHVYADTADEIDAKLEPELERTA